MKNAVGEEVEGSKSDEANAEAKEAGECAVKEFVIGESLEEFDTFI